MRTVTESGWGLRSCRRSRQRPAPRHPTRRRPFWCRPGGRTRSGHSGLLLRPRGTPWSPPQLPPLPWPLLSGCLASEARASARGWGSSRALPAGSCLALQDAASPPQAGVGTGLLRRPPLPPWPLRLVLGLLGARRGRGGPWARGPAALAPQSVAAFCLHRLARPISPRCRASGPPPLGPAAGAKVHGGDGAGGPHPCRRGPVLEVPAAGWGGRHPA